MNHVSSVKQDDKNTLFSVCKVLFGEYCFNGYSFNKSQFNVRVVRFSLPCLFPSPYKFPLLSFLYLMTFSSKASKKCLGKHYKISFLTVSQAIETHLLKLPNFLDDFDRKMQLVGCLANCKMEEKPKHCAHHCFLLSQYFM